jgi:hydrogenase nickel incorporation protein HypA/HybF
MHEFSLLADLMRKIESIAEQHSAQRVQHVTVWLGALSHISTDHLREHFSFASQSTVAEGAELTIETGDDVNDPNAQEIILKSVELE